MRFLLTWAIVGLSSLPVSAADLPNILWVSSEDNGPHLGCYGDEYADTPNIDALASRGIVYLNAWSTAPVCAPARTTIISGMYPPSLGAQHMRSMVQLPDSFKMFPQYLREAGYYCTNNSKEDYNLRKPGEVWDESSRKAHWRGRKDGQPFFSVFNFTTTHESQIRKRKGHKPVHDPAKVRVPAYHPDAPEVRQDWAQYYDKLTEMDRQVGRVLQELDDDGLRENTIVFYFGDHGAGMPRSKRWPYNSGLHVPLVVSIPEKYRSLTTEKSIANSKSNRLVAFVDFAPTVLSLAGVEPPSHMEGRAFLGRHEAGAKPFLHGFRGRMDERIDMVRTIRNQRFQYIRNYLPHRRYGEHVDYMFQTPTTKVWKARFDAGELNEQQSHFWQVKPSEELYDLRSDPDQVHNLVNSPEHAKVLRDLRIAQHDFLMETRDTGFLPEAMMHERAGNSTIYDMAHDPDRYPLREILEVADLATFRPAKQVNTKLLPKLFADDAAIRYWAVIGFTVRGEEAVRFAEDDLIERFSDDSASVAIAAAEAVARYGSKANRDAALEVLVKYADPQTKDVFTSTLALNALDIVGADAKPVWEQLQETNFNHPDFGKRMRMGGIPKNLINHIGSQVEER
ncbi:sulfatase family protein [Thalassoroseus pseudoceratinae]|uniref:sulfatase family protein n=1 Tax=Thalassoroseus pseudoceratinae TaxID=2713176 RepID=UPI001423EA56|nr:sulfatase [Thalassoroseus pseudoceratinae]